MRTPLLVGLAAVLVIIAWAFVKSGHAPSVVPDTKKMPPAITVSDWTRGNPQARATLIEYGDFQCPACASYHPLTDDLVKNFGDNLFFVYRNFPLTKIHDSAELSAAAAEAAGLQGKYWQMHAWLYENQLQWASIPLTARAFIEKHAQSMGLDMEKFKTDIDSVTVREKIRTDQQGGLDAGVGHTPTFFLNGAEIPNPQSYEEFKAVIENELDGT